jgi:hypothetical protein
MENFARGMIHPSTVFFHPRLGFWLSFGSGDKSCREDGASPLVIFTSQRCSSRLRRFAWKTLPGG